MLKTIN